MSDKSSRDVVEPSASVGALFAPFDLGPYTLHNRIVMAPMTRNRASDGFVPLPVSATYYEQRAGAGLIITEASQVSPQGAGYPRTPGIYNSDHVVGWRRVTDAVHDRGGRIFLQLWHAGRISHPSVQPHYAAPVAPSPIQAKGTLMTVDGTQPYVVPRALETAELAGIVDQFRSGARHAMEAGFDGVELHAANGYLLDQFIRDGSNRRSDGFGGPVENRARLLLQVTEAVAGVWGGDRVGVRISPLVNVHSVWDSNPEATFTYIARELSRRRIAYLHVFEKSIFLLDPPARLDFASLRKAFAGAYIANGGYDAQSASGAIASTRADLVSFGVPFISNPDLPARMACNAALAPADPATYYQGGEKGYIDYPPMNSA